MNIETKGFIWIFHVGLKAQALGPSPTVFPGTKQQMKCEFSQIDEG